MSFDEILAICIEKIERGDSVESCLQQYPDERAELEPLLRLASALSSAPAPQMSAHAFASGRMRMFEAANKQFDPESYEQQSAINETNQFYTNGYQSGSHQNGDVSSHHQRTSPLHTGTQRDAQQSGWLKPKSRLAGAPASNKRVRAAARASRAHDASASGKGIADNCASAARRFRSWLMAQATDFRMSL